ncbi:baseplate J/gp47 family protein [Candidatus Saccharibacteria bacterium]|nr:baseplate J/gp47 family protein [Candidatus Saccharibacteria bacterium]
MSLKDLTLQELIDMGLSKVDTEIDRRTGSIIYDTIASAAVPMLFIALEGASIDEATYIATSYGEYLDKRVAEKGLERLQATAAIKKATFTDTNGAAIVPIGTRFSTIDTLEPLVYTVKAETELKGTYLVECETRGTVGNGYFGKLLPISYINALSSAEITGDYQVARNQETDEELRARYYEAVKRTPFGGNVSQYEEEVKKLSGVGDLQIHRAYPSSGHILLSIVGVNRRKITQDLIEDLQMQIDPGEEGTGLGIAPIFHKVKVVTPTEVTIPISFDLTVLNGYTVEQLEPLIKQKLEEYFDQLRKSWGTLDAQQHAYDITIYVSRIIVSISTILGVANVSNVKINSIANDLRLIETGEAQQLPLLGAVKING